MTRTRTYKTDASEQTTNYCVVWCNKDGDQKTRSFDNAKAAKSWCEYLTEDGIDDFQTEYTLTKFVSWRDI